MSPTSAGGVPALAPTPVSDDALCWPLAVEDTTTVIQARAVLRGALAVLGLDADAIDDAERGAAELVGNAARHARPPVELRLRTRAGTVLIAVVDGDENMPAWPAATPSPDTLLADGADLDEVLDGLPTAGRGLALVRHLSEGRCGAHLTRTDGGSPGKAVWFSQPLAAHRVSRPADTEERTDA